MKEIFKSVKEKLTSKYLENDRLKSGNVFKNVREKLSAKYLEKKGFKNTKKFKPRIKARIRKNKQIINKNIDNFLAGSRELNWLSLNNVIQLKIQ